MVSGFKADMGGTELFSPLSTILNRPPLEGVITLRHIFLLTDGAVDNTNEVI